MFKKAIIITLLLAVSASGALAQINDNVETLEVKVGFRSHNSTFDISYKNNRKAVNELVSEVREKISKGYYIKEFNVYASSSLEGRTDFNKTVRAERADNIVSYFKGVLSIYDYMINKEYDDVDWKNLERAVMASDMDYKQEVLDIIRYTPEWIKNSAGVIVDGRKRQLQNLNDGDVWWYMYDYIFPSLRNSTVQVVMEKGSSAMQYKRSVPEVKKKAPASKPKKGEIFFVRDTVKIVDTVYVYDPLNMRDLKNKR